MLKKLMRLAPLHQTQDFLYTSHRGNRSQENRLIIELGAGNGNFTKAVLKKLNKNQKLLSFETNKKLFAYLENMNNRRLIAVNDKAENMEAYIKNIISGKRTTYYRNFR